MENLESRYRVTGMDCASCGSKVDAAVRKLPGVTDVAVAVSSGVLKVQHGADFAGEGVLRQVRNLG
ncbi:heavy-metal-associated domain-containing protein [Brevundimonas diminuta]|nr:cation transporter [Brevundimonas diminuta]WQE46628.1 cation transporter [Brevundimonas diminuta]